MQRATCNELASLDCLDGKSLVKFISKTLHLNAQTALGGGEREVEHRRQGSGSDCHTFGIMLPHTKLKPPTHTRAHATPLLNTHTHTHTLTLGHPLALSL